MTTKAQKDFAPMLSATVKKAEALRFPLLGSPKFDGIRAVVRNSTLLSRNLEPIPNKRLQAIFGKAIYNGLDGELIVGDPTAPDCFRKTSSGVMSVEGEPDALLYAFDCFTNPDDEFIHRQYSMARIAMKSGRIRIVEQTELRSVEELLEYEGRNLDLGHEGIMLRNPYSFYKYGRGTVGAQDLMKLKRFEDAEAIIIGYYEEEANANAATKDALGRTKRSTAKAGKAGKGTLGALRCRCLNGAFKGAEFDIGTFQGLKAADKLALWAVRESLVGKIVKFRYFPSGSKERPRFPVFMGFRDKMDF